MSPDLSALILQSAGGVHFDATITLGNVLTLVLLALATVKFWSAQVESKKDLEWRITNLEIWRKEHTVDADSRDHIQAKMGEIISELKWVADARQKAANAPPGKRRMEDY